MVRRLFFACWPDDRIREQLIARRDLIDGLSRRRVPDHNLHLTLLFLGNQPADRLKDIQSLADDLEARFFALELDRFGWFQQAGVAWLGGPATPGASRLVKALAAGAMARGLVFQARAFQPHVSLFRQVRACPALPVPASLRWPISGFSLIESIPSRPYQVLRTWPLSMGST
ncbi:MAG: RNA 2',3'-cyclic phosphodiesterase [Wenzhouxiangella sp.]|nr:RNA 2',3'-cyclic phosphodiesterase [Wenzhouxiangella sp.]MCH8477870.1 RNA 2',3'-cyclic phosphodiesterase [Wenzhouxiangella sp.]TVR92357.1 MAG: RNA 2',3'-cyclic phosphodiesterase [Wenzhouxiangellaceae bacterium]